MSSVSLVKGGNISLDKAAPGLTKVRVGLGWDVRKTSGQDFDLDASAFLLNGQDKVSKKEDFVYYNNLKSLNEAVIHTGDNRTGEGEGDDESIKVDLSKLDPSIKKIVFTVSIHEAELRKQNFGQVNNAFIRILDDNTSKEIARYDLQEDASTDQALIFGELYKHNEEWKFRAVGQGFKENLAGLVKHYGL